MSAMTMRRAWWSRTPAAACAPLLLWATLLALGDGCKANSVAAPTSCVRDEQCGAGLACISGSCISGGGSDRTWAIELLPRSDSSAAPTQFSAITFSDDVTVLTADAKVTVSGRLAPGSSLEGNSHVIATLQTAIPGHADLQLETDWLLPDGAAQPPPFSLTVPGSAIGRTATFRILPLPPRDQGQAPVTILATLAPSLDLTLANNSFYIDGRLVTSSAPTSVEGFTARAFQAGQLVSNVVNVPANGGTFHLEIPAEPAYAMTGRPVTVEITPAGATYTTPRFVTPTIVIRGNVDVGQLNLPSAATANRYRFKVVGPDQQPVVGAAVRVRTVLASDAHGVADFLRDGTSDAGGTLDLALIPGSPEAARFYDISVIPPLSSPFGIACTNAVAITIPGLAMGGPGDAPLVATLALPPKISLSGTILDSDGLPVSGVAISATRSAADPSSSCPSSVASAPTSASSEKNGTFRVLVDPGTYRLDYDPPAGAPVPRLTEIGMVVTAAGVPDRTIQMQPGALVKGAVRGADSRPLAFVGVRLFDVACSGQDACYGINRVEPILRAQTHTDADGTFRAVVPMQSP